MSTPAPPVVRLSTPHKVVRAAIVVVLVIGFCAGSLVGDDHWWPFSPWRMFSTSQAPTGVVWSTAIEVRTTHDPTQWVKARLTPENVGVNRAEIEGRFPEIAANPDQLGTLAFSHSQLRPASARWVGVRVVRHKIAVKDREPTGERDVEVLAEWEAK